jgi:hypothetical protein
MGAGVLSRGKKKLGREFNHSPPSGVEFKNMWSYTFTPHTPLWRVEGQICLFFQSRLYCPMKYKIRQFEVRRI